MTRTFPLAHIAAALMVLAYLPGVSAQTSPLAPGTVSNVTLFPSPGTAGQCPGDF